MLVQFQEGPSGVLAPGAFGTPRLLGDSTTGVADCHAKYQEAVYRGRVYSVADTAYHTMPAGLSASPINVSLYNPISSGVNAAIWFANAVFGVAWPAAAIIWLATYTSPNTATTGTALNATNSLTGAIGTSVIKPLTTATLGSTPTAQMILGQGLTGAITVETQGKVVGGWLDGSFILSPGQTLTIESSTVSGTTGAAVSWIWEEFPQVFG
jgi:hypothetical protein